MAKYKVKTGFCLGNHVDVYDGDEIEVEDNVARAWLALGFIEPVAGETPPPAETLTTGAAGKRTGKGGGA